MHIYIYIHTITNDEKRGHKFQGDWGKVDGGV